MWEQEGKQELSGIEGVLVENDKQEKEFLLTI
jgi:hypothetical protein